jgi:sulfoxide reductase heme-binding subunit YedZ
MLPLFYISLRYSFSFGWHWPLVLATFVKEHLHYEIGGFPVDFWKFVLHVSAKTALNLFIITLALKPLYNLLTINFLRYRKMIGLFGFFYLLLHVSVFLGIQHHFAFGEIYSAMQQHLFLWFGMVAFLIFFMMAFTSIPFLFKRFSSWHKLFYFAMVLVMMHFLLSQKELENDVLIYVAIISSLLSLRLLKR